MPSPATIPRRSSSDPDLTITISKSEILKHRSSRSSASSTRPLKLSYWNSWSNINKLGDYVSPRRRGNDSSNHSDLTEESLDAHNKLHGIVSNEVHMISDYISRSVDEKNNKCSPYYKGLTDSTLSINREKNMSGADSPGRESLTTSASSSWSSLLVKMQEFGSSFFTFTKTGNKGPSPPAAPKSVKPTSSSSTYTKASAPNEMKSEEKEAGDPPDAQLFDKEKPLRERVLEPSAPIILLAKTFVDNDEKEEANIHKVNQKFILADKYRPKALKDFICNRSEATRLQALVKYGPSAHVIFEGPPGVGKRTMIWAMLRETFGPDRVQTRDKRKVFDLKGESIGRIEVNVKESSKHVEVNLSDLRGYVKHVIVELMKETRTKTYKSNKALSSYPEKCRAIILSDADKLSTDALLYIRWLLERYKGDNKFFFCCSDVSKLQPVRSLCTLIQLLPPSKQEIVEVLEFIAKQEGLYLPRKFAEEIANSSKNNLRQAIRSFEACWHSSYPFKQDQVILTGWEEDIANIARNIIEEQSPKQLYIIRGKLQILIEHDVSPDFIFMSLFEEVKKHLQENLHPQVCCLYDEYNVRTPISTFS
ncbi:replication factor C subunit 3-like [Durio zibethinus]|uniref:Replication factor C subunit 3-like n=1 Tax=Durio zibethinus TaxID=66656 RepID=A0A6P5XTU1_DURZI|nr:replication factor C subunit 3-like [Durio zibethinus]